MTIDPKDVTRGLDSMKPEACTHPTDQILDFPDRSFCKRCQKDVPPLMRDKPSAMDWMGRVRKSVFPVFPSVDKPQWLQLREQNAAEGRDETGGFLPGEE